MWGRRWAGLIKADCTDESDCPTHTHTHTRDRDVFAQTAKSFADIDKQFVPS